MNLPARVVNRLKYAGFCLAAWMVVHVPEDVAYAAATPLGVLFAWLTPKRRARVMDNLAHVSGKASRRELIRLSASVYGNVVRYYVDLFRSPLRRSEDLRGSRIRMVGLEHLSHATAAGQGVILATMHFGALELALQAARAWGFEFLVLTEPLEPAELSRLFTRLRAAGGHELLPAGFGGLRAAIRKLRAGGAVLLVVDRDIQHNGMIVPFFGTPARMPLGAVELARATGAPIILGVSTRLAAGRAEVCFEPPLALARTADRGRDLETNVSRLTAGLEPHIQRAPEQWLVLDRIWPCEDSGG